MALTCPDAGPTTCRRCHKEGHMAKECGLPMICRHCGEEGHLIKECPTAPPRVCKNCGADGKWHANPAI